MATARPKLRDLVAGCARNDYRVAGFRPVLRSQCVPTWDHLTCRACRRHRVRAFITGSAFDRRRVRAFIPRSEGIRLPGMDLTNACPRAGWRGRSLDRSPCEQSSPRIQPASRKHFDPLSDPDSRSRDRLESPFNGASSQASVIRTLEKCQCGYAMRFRLGSDWGSSPSSRFGRACITQRGSPRDCEWLHAALAEASGFRRIRVGRGGL